MANGQIASGWSGNRRGFIKSTLSAAGLAFAGKAWAERQGSFAPGVRGYFEAWHGSDPQKVLAFFSDDIVINPVGSEGSLTGKQAVGDNWVIPNMKRFPGNIHHVQTYFESFVVERGRIVARS